MKVDLDVILDNIQARAAMADDKARAACKKSKHSIAEYWVCIEFKMQQLFDDIAMQHSSPRRCGHFAFRRRMNDFRRTL